jgi:putative sterol carrier protein
MNTPEKNSPTDQTKNKKRYLFVQRDDKEYSAIKLIDDKYLNVIYKYGKVGFADKEDANGNLPMKFDYDILRNPENKDIDNQEFIDYIGDILIELLDKQLKDGTAVFK